MQERDLSKVTSALLSTYLSNLSWLQVLQSSNFELRCNLYSPWNSPGQNTGVGSLSLLQRIFSTQSAPSMEKAYVEETMLLSRFSRVRLCATPLTAAHQAPPSLGFSRQEHWSGLPFHSPMHGSEK